VALDAGSLDLAVGCFEEALRHYTVLGRRHAADQILVMLGAARTLAGDPRGPALLRDAGHSAGLPMVRASAWALLAIATSRADPDASLAASRRAREILGDEATQGGIGAILALADPGDELPADVLALASGALDVRLALALRRAALTGG
jgi:hypothetical protein